jgi:hypothetical protein
MPVPFGMAGRRASVISSFYESIPMSIQCPQCGSTRITTRDVGKQVGGATGVIAGGITGWTSAVTGARIGTTVGLMGGPAVIALGCVADIQPQLGCQWCGSNSSMQLARCVGSRFRTSLRYAYGSCPFMRAD